MKKKIKNKKLFTPGPLNTSDTTKKSTLVDLGSRDNDFIRINKSLIFNLLKIAHCSKSYVCIPIQGSGTFCLEATFSTLINKNSKILILTNGVYGDRLINICKKINKKFVILRFDEKQTLDIDRTEEYLKKNKSITHIALVHCETSSGILNPLNGIAALSKKYKKKVIVDAMSSFGGIDINVEKNNIDVLVSSANKCLEGIPGFAFSLIKKSLLNKFKDNAKSLSLDLYDQWKAFLKNNQWRFTPPTHSIVALDSSLQQLKKEGGVKNRYKRYKKNYDVLINGMNKIGFKCFLENKYHSPIIVSFEFPKVRNFNFNLFYKNLCSLGYVIYPGSVTSSKTFRIGCIGNINFKDIQKLLVAIKKTLRKMKIKYLSI